jgi:hypothetical protein
MPKYTIYTKRRLCLSGLIRSSPGVGRQLMMHRESWREYSGMPVPNREVRHSSVLGEDMNGQARVLDRIRQVRCPSPLKLPYTIGASTSQFNIHFLNRRQLEF